MPEPFTLVLVGKDGFSRVIKSSNAPYALKIPRVEGHCNSGELANPAITNRVFHQMEQITSTTWLYEEV
jgi:hypothetical protein